MIMRIPTHCNHPWYSIKIGKRLASRYHPSRLCKGIWQSSTPLPSDLHKLEYYGVNPKTNRWIRSFLENRKQSVILEGTVSKQVPVLSGVSQGTVLGPLLFLAYINDMPETATSSEIKLFADDSLLYHTINNQTDSDLLQRDLTFL
jgi:hypothetical protein